MESRTKRNLVTRNAFHTCLCFPPPVGNEQNQEGKPCQERNKSQICQPHASLPQVSRRRMQKEGQRSPGVTGTDDLPRAPALTQFTQGCSATPSALPLRAHRMSCSAMNLRLSCPPPLGQLCACLFKHNVHSRLDRSLNSTLPGSIVRCRKSCRIFRRRLAVKQPMVVQFRYVKSELPLHCNDDAGRNPWRWQIFLGDGRSKVPLPSIDFLSCGVGCEFHHHHDCNCAAGGRRKISCPLGGPPLAHIILSRS